MTHGSACTVQDCTVGGRLGGASSRAKREAAPRLGGAWLGTHGRGPSARDGGRAWHGVAAAASARRCGPAAHDMPRISSLPAPPAPSVSGTGLSKLTLR
eukprot:scaffold1085_cov407-Prasinococcus_capsulatus_cf.AAC.8